MFENTVELVSGNTPVEQILATQRIERKVADPEARQEILDMLGLTNGTAR